MTEQAGSAPEIPPSRRSGHEVPPWRYVILAAVLILAVAGGVQWWSRWSAPYSLPQVPQALTWEQAGLDLALELEATQSERYEMVRQLLVRGDEEGLTYLMEVVRSDPENLVYGNLLRQELLARERYEELTRFWAELPEQGTKVRIQHALALVDGMQDPHIGNANLGRLSMASMAELGVILDENPYHWVARYARGLNNLYWPIGFKRVDKALSDLGFALAIQQSLPDQRPGYLALTYAAYGDALVKTDRVGAGVRVWKEGLKLFPEAEILQRRVKAGVAGARDLVRAERGIEDFARPVRGTTDLSSLWN